MKKLLTIFLSVLGFLVALYLYFPYAAGTSVGACTPNPNTGVSGCDAVRLSEYANMFGISMPTWGMIFYVTLILYVLFKPKKAINIERHIGISFDAFLVLFGFLYSAYLTYLEAYVIFAWCKFCIVNAVIATLLLLLYIALSPTTSSIIYRILRPILFLFDSEFIHNIFVSTGKVMGKSRIAKSILKDMCLIKDDRLHTTISSLKFSNPVGLAAGFDYNADLVPMLPSLGFGYEVVGSITTLPYEGNTPPRLGRLIKSKSLRVWKGLKNKGTKNIKDLLIKQPDYVLGVSVAPSNDECLSSLDLQVADICQSILLLQDTPTNYIEINISCPNSFGGETMANASDLEELLTSVEKTGNTIPIMLKYPIEISDQDVISLTKVAINHNVIAVVVGNLVKDRSNKAFNKKEIENLEGIDGNFSGLPCKEQSNHLISLIYKNFKEDIAIIGVGGIESGKDAYEKIRLGATTVQLITGLVYKGPTLVHHINSDILELLDKDGFRSITEAVGADHK